MKSLKRGRNLVYRRFDAVAAAKCLFTHSCEVQKRELSVLFDFYTEFQIISTDVVNNFTWHKWRVLAIAKNRATDRGVASVAHPAQI